MVEEIITSGRMTPEVDPILHIWGWEIPLYLFLGGFAAGILFFSALFTLQNKEDRYSMAVKVLPLAVPVLLALGLGALFLDLSHKRYFWQLYTNIRWESPMSWGAWTLLLVTPLSIVWAASWIEDLFPKLDLRYDWLKQAIHMIRDYQKPMAWALIVLAVILGMYTGILLSAFNARPFWNSAIMGPLFLTSGLSTAAAAIALLARDHAERSMFTKIDLVLIAVELFFIIHLFMGFLASTQVHIQAAEMFLGGEFTVPFWVWVVGIGLAVPALLEILELRKRGVPTFVPALMVIGGSLMLRFIVVEAGQASRWLY
ncbi:MAG: polysulfide reductase NrfD [Lentisphaeria bacterium]|nr:polysulfide reductase NrfD [Candidatus Neomarinimicrobiota bacterium]MCF7842946.1 polysulfide reductase NrfD [Lentisphaeria bacterium]